MTSRSARKLLLPFDQRIARKLLFHKPYSMKLVYHGGESP